MAQFGEMRRALLTINTTSKRYLWGGVARGIFEHLQGEHQAGCADWLRAAQLYQVNPEGSLLVQNFIALSLLARGCK
jgi:hypothetical protein